MTEGIRDKYMSATFERDRIIKTMIIGFLMGIAACIGVFSMIEHDYTLQSVYILAIFGISLSGMPYMWSKLPRIDNVLNPISWFLLIFKFVFATFSGVIFTPIMLLIKIVQAIVYNKQLKEIYHHPKIV